MATFSSSIFFVLERVTLPDRFESARIQIRARKREEEIVEFFIDKNDRLEKRKVWRENSVPLVVEVKMAREICMARASVCRNFDRLHSRNIPRKRRINSLSEVSDVSNVRGRGEAFKVLSPRRFPDARARRRCAGTAGISRRRPRPLISANLSENNALKRSPASCPGGGGKERTFVLSRMEFVLLDRFGDVEMLSPS